MVMLLSMGTTVSQCVNQSRNIYVHGSKSQKLSIGMAGLALVTYHQLLSMRW